MILIIASDIVPFGHVIAVLVMWLLLSNQSVKKVSAYVFIVDGIRHIKDVFIVDSIRCVKDVFMVDGIRRIKDVFIVDGIRCLKEVFTINGCRIR